jgi:hypothetical protein
MGLGGGIPDGFFYNFGGATFFVVCSTPSSIVHLPWFGSVFPNFSLNLLSSLSSAYHWIHFEQFNTHVIKAQIHHSMVKQNIFLSLNRLPHDLHSNDGLLPISTSTCQMSKYASKANCLYSFSRYKVTQ